MRDEVTTIREFVSNIEIVCTTMNGVTKPWAIFVEAIVSMDKFPSWDKLSDDFMQEEAHRGFVHKISSNSREDEDNVPLTTKGKKEYKKGPE